MIKNKFGNAVAELVFLFLHAKPGIAPGKMFWVVSSVGLEHYLDRVGVTGSNPVQPTKQNYFATTL